jgi:hypothetical protein
MVIVWNKINKHYFSANDHKEANILNLGLLQPAKMCTKNFTFAGFTHANVKNKQAKSSKW